MHPWLKMLITFASLAVLALLAPLAGYAIGTAAIGLFHLTGIPATIVVTVMLVGVGALGVKAAMWLVGRRGAEGVSE